MYSLSNVSGLKPVDRYQAYVANRENYVRLLDDKLGKGKWTDEGMEEIDQLITGASHDYIDEEEAKKNVKNDSYAYAIKLR